MSLNQLSASRDNRQEIVFIDSPLLPPPFLPTFIRYRWEIGQFKTVILRISLLMAFK